ncbi:hypothetical protein AUP77_18745 [Escherichia coli]|nr:hypothetical protein AUP77_18745 [Escherichia coli]
MSQLIQNIKQKQKKKKEEELQEQEILNKLINSNNSLNEELRRLDERTASSQSLLKQQMKELEEIEDRYNQLYIMLEDTLERFQLILEKTNTKDILKKKNDSKKKNNLTKKEEKNLYIEDIKSMLNILLDQYEKTANK